METPAEIARILRVAGGLNRYGEPNYRAVWGWNRLDWIGGEWTDRENGEEENGAFVRTVYQVRHVPKYSPFDRWYIERWMPPETYGHPALWNLQHLEKTDSGEWMPTLGPFPYRGDYEMAWRCETPDGGYLQLTPHIARVFASCLEASRNLAKQSLTEFKSKEIDKREKEYDSYADSVLHEGSTITGPSVSVL